MENENLTPNVQITPDPNSKEAELFKEGEDNGREAEVVPPKEPEIDYKARYVESSKGAEQIALKAKELQANLEDREAKLNSLLQEKTELEQRLQGENPEGYDTFQMKKELNEMKTEIVLQKEEQQLEKFVASNPEAKAQKEALKTLGRANPNKSYDELYSNYLKPVYEAGARDYETKIKEKKQSQPETGKSAEPTPTTTTDEAEFNNLSLAERRRRFIGMGL